MKRVFVAGTILVDRIHAIDAYPHVGELAQIRSVARTPGGLVPNVGIDLRIFAPDVPVHACGAVGSDEVGLFVRDEMFRHGIDVSRVVVSKKSATSFTDVMSVAGGDRTFFTYAGACAEWGYDDFPFDAVQPGDIVLLGYFLLLAKIDAGDGLRILQELKRRGVETAIDLVTEHSDRYKLLRECLPYVDNLIVNEHEAARIAGVELETADGLEDLAQALRNAGAAGNVIVHSPSAGVFMERDGSIVKSPSVPLPRGFVKDKTGAGDAFCAGILAGLSRGASAMASLELASIAAVGALSAEGATSGMKNEKELRKLCLLLSNRS